MPLEVVLFPRKVPQEVTEIHPPHLIILEVTEVFRCAGNQIGLNAVEHSFHLTHTADVFLRATAVRLHRC